jgi:hypothetical protein
MPRSVAALGLDPIANTARPVRAYRSQTAVATATATANRTIHGTPSGDVCDRRISDAGRSLLSTCRPPL